MTRHPMALSKKQGKQTITTMQTFMVMQGPLRIRLESGKIFASFTKFSFLHSFSYIPMHESTFAVHKIKLMIDAREDFSNSGGVADHAASTHHLGQVATWNHCWRLVVDTALEPCRTPIHELNRPLGFDSSNRCVHILGDHIATVHHAASHVLAMAWIALHEHRCGLKNRHCDFRNGKLLVVGLLC